MNGFSLSPLSPSSPAAAIPFSGLTPECILDALESVDFCCDGSLMALLTNEQIDAAMAASAPAAESTGE